MENMDRVEDKRVVESAAPAVDSNVVVAKRPRKDLKSKISQKGIDNIKDYVIAEPRLPEPVAPQPPKPHHSGQNSFLPHSGPFPPFYPSWTDANYSKGSNPIESMQIVQAEIMRQIIQAAQSTQPQFAYPGPRNPRPYVHSEVRQPSAHTSYQKKRTEVDEKASQHGPSAESELLENITDYAVTGEEVSPVPKPGDQPEKSDWDKPEKLPSPPKAGSEVELRQNAFKKRSQSEDYEYIGESQDQANALEVEKPAPTLPSDEIYEKDTRNEPVDNTPAAAESDEEEFSEEEMEEIPMPEPDRRYQEIIAYVINFKKSPSSKIKAIIPNFTNPHLQKTGLGTVSSFPLGRSTSHISRLPVSQGLVMQRMRVSDEVMIQMKYIKEHADHWLVSKNEDDEEAKLYRTVKHTLNKLSPDNFDIVSKELLDRCAVEKTVDMIIDCLVRKAWNEPVYTHWYAKLAALMAEKPMVWEKSLEKPEKKRSAVKSKLLAQVQTKYITGFEEYHEQARKIADNTSLAPQEKQEKLNKIRKVLLGNMNFISELHESKILGSDAIQWVVFFGIWRFLNEFLQPSKEFSVKEDYLEALLKLFENSGKKLESRIVKLKVPEEDPEIIDLLEKILTSDPELKETFYTFVDRKKVHVKSISEIFFKFLVAVKNCHFRSISIRVDSLIDNLLDFRRSNWSLKAGRIEAAKSLSEVHGRQPAQAAKPVGRERTTEAYVKKWEPEEKVFDQEKFRVSLLNFTKLFEKEVNEADPVKDYESLLFSAVNPLPVLLVTWAENVREIDAIQPRIQIVAKLFEQKVLKAESLYSALPSAYVELAGMGSEQPKKHEALARLFAGLRAKGLIDLSRLGIQPERPDVTDDDVRQDLKGLMTSLLEELTKACQEVITDPKAAHELAALRERFKP